MISKIIFIVIYVSVVMPLCELLVDWLEYKLRAEIFIQSHCSNFKEYRKYKKSLFGNIINLKLRKNNNDRSKPLG